MTAEQLKQLKSDPTVIKITPRIINYHPASDLHIEFKKLLQKNRIIYTIEIKHQDTPIYRKAIELLADMPESEINAAITQHAIDCLASEIQQLSTIKDFLVRSLPLIQHGDLILPASTPVSTAQNSPPPPAP